MRPDSLWWMERKTRVKKLATIAQEDVWHIILHSHDYWYLHSPICVIATLSSWMPISAIKLLPSRPSSIMKIVACDPTYYFSCLEARHFAIFSMLSLLSNVWSIFFLSNSRSIALRKRVIQNLRAAASARESNLSRWPWTPTRCFRYYSHFTFWWPWMEGNLLPVRKTRGSPIWPTSSACSDQVSKWVALTLIAHWYMTP